MQQPYCRQQHRTKGQQGVCSNGSGAVNSTQGVGCTSEYVDIAGKQGCYATLGRLSNRRATAAETGGGQAVARSEHWEQQPNKHAEQHAGANLQQAGAGKGSKAREASHVRRRNQAAFELVMQRVAP